MVESSLHYPIFGAEIPCPHCRQMIPALTLTDSYLCDRHGAFEADPETETLVHLQSSRQWKRWEEKWYRQHTHPDGIRFEIHEALDRLYTQGLRATKITIAQRYQTLMRRTLDFKSAPGRGDITTTDYATTPSVPHLYGLPVFFHDAGDRQDRWQIVNFELETEPGSPRRYPYHYLSRE
ncbi:TIGR02652 family protein [Picosynechococcus sp. PCC 7117]|uniref:TIGR02652 family protein n=1 Tax=Picosynechococcus sp. PCC 7117 TaxID=195498 RepID=UPI00081061DB|nr:TIGR02652 family protein [Picosynechococcus sp. PCC 7117]ANV87071.1 TIGR02652 family protein [Picosynechococcus sp. PCC 7117]